MAQGVRVHQLTSIKRSTYTAICSKCGPVDIVSNGSGFRCKTASDEYHRNVRKQTHGLTYQELAKLINEADGCEICGENPKRLVGDHNHTTGKFRGILCDRCNLSLGLIEDPALLEQALRYLQRTEE
jgi:hypothetical protein